MRLLIATTHRRIVGGIETYLRTLLPELGRRGVEVGLLHELSPPPGQALVDERVPGIPSWDVQSMGIRAALAGARAFRPDLVFQHCLFEPEVEEELLELAPSVLFAHVYHGGCISGTKRFAVPHARPCDRAFGPACLALYLPRRCGGLSPRSMWREYSLQARRRALMRRHRAVVVASRRMRREYTPGLLPEGRVHVVPPFPGGVAPDGAPPAPRKSTGRVLMLGRLTPLKGGHLLVPAMAEASRELGRRLELWVAGDGGERGRMEALGRRLDVPMRFSGWVSDVQREELMRASDLLAAPSVWPEPFGMVGVEAGCVGLPAVGFASGGIPDWLEPGVSGELAPADPPTARGLAAALVRALRDEAHHQRLREGAWRMAGRFTPEAHLETLLGILRRAASAEDRSGASPSASLANG